MELIFGVEDLQPRHRPCVATIGNYDGVHLGHQAVLTGLVSKGSELGVPTTVITFEPLAKEYFQGGAIGGRLTTVKERAHLLGQFGIDQVLCLTFDDALAFMPAEEFVRTILVDGLEIRYLVVGDDFKYGRDRSGDFGSLEVAGSEFGFYLQATTSFRQGETRVSSGRIRDALRAGDVGLAHAMLGRPFSISGTVVHGDQLGRTIGFPTANLLLGDREVPVSGVFAVIVVGEGLGSLAGVANVGTRPTVDGDEQRLEVHVLEFTGDLYGDDIRVEFVKKIRDEQKFSGVDELKKQIRIDVQEAREVLDRVE